MRRTDEDLDRIVDDAARTMMSGDADAGFRARVLARLDARPAGLAAARRPVSTWLVLGSAAAAAAFALLAGQIVIRREPPTAAASLQVRSTAEAPAATTSAAAARTIASERVAATSGQPSTAGSAHRRTAPHAAPPEGFELQTDWNAGPAPLPELQALDIGANEPRAIEVGDLTIAPLGDVHPIDVPAAGPASPDPQRRDPQ
jgi:hypothetical protein